jgi:hypothetical protein
MVREGLDLIIRPFTLEKGRVIPARVATPGFAGLIQGRWQTGGAPFRRRCAISPPSQPGNDYLH